MQEKRAYETCNTYIYNIYFVNIKAYSILDNHSSLMAIYLKDSFIVLCMHQILFFYKKQQWCINAFLLWWLKWQIHARTPYDECLFILAIWVTVHKIEPGPIMLWSLEIAIIACFFIQAFRTNRPLTNVWSSWSYEIFCKYTNDK